MKKKLASCEVSWGETGRRGLVSGDERTSLKENRGQSLGLPEGEPCGHFFPKVSLTPIV